MSLTLVMLICLNFKWHILHQFDPVQLLATYILIIMVLLASSIQDMIRILLDTLCLIMYAGSSSEHPSLGWSLFEWTKIKASGSLISVCCTPVRTPVRFLRTWNAFVDTLCTSAAGDSTIFFVFDFCSQHPLTTAFTLSSSLICDTGLQKG